MNLKPVRKTAVHSGGAVRIYKEKIEHRGSCSTPMAVLSYDWVTGTVTVPRKKQMVQAGIEDVFMLTCCFARNL